MLNKYSITCLSVCVLVDPGETSIRLTVPFLGGLMYGRNTSCLAFWRCRMCLMEALSAENTYKFSHVSYLGE